VKQMMVRKRRPYNVGSENGRARLSEDGAREIRKKYKGPWLGPSHCTLAKEYGVNPETIRLVLLGETWRHV
jgi:hypothetical protein